MENNGSMKSERHRYGGDKYTANPDVFYRTKSGNAYNYKPLRNKRDVWTISTKPFKGAHFAVFPEELITPCILAGSALGGIVLDPFMGSGTTAKVALETGRKFIGFEINKDYCRMASKRIRQLLMQCSLFDEEQSKEAE